MLRLAGVERRRPPGERSQFGRRTAATGQLGLIEHFMLMPKGSQSVQLAADRISILRGYSDAAITLLEAWY
ncbi:hypothetical protein [Burkholderia gladioli]|uniref:hypothetical protein n=1 Tax=Burkholderia gladioli TaxID=28095 RepID=UPI00163F4A17|nr:hypothetical protein [Burkholderia gladioli]